MKIESGRPVTSAGAGKAAGKTAAPGFAPAAEGPQRTAATSAASAVTPLDALIALQAEEDPARRRARQARRGAEALDALEELERGLLLGRAPGGLKAQLERLRRDAETTGEAGLDAVLNEIDIRLAVELAKLERAL
ncbi:MAG TPA: flagellar assembly protein FliX [Terricaulis sp.]|nr:flagellar assembly protein FliX [Terricaulis sp.]